ncbi:MAG: phenylalanine--tRNA ligase subunit beta, partial [Desulfobulbaceae bacterium]|nr:phenylalanine--tRNA ligase subunit beta [Desulfobulbaceae bacterium]
LGMEFTADRIKDFLTGIEINVKILDQGILSVTPPGFRVDLEREVDLIEEIARIKGFNEFPTTLPSVPMSFPETNIDRVLRKQLSSVMTSLGFHEAINYSFTSDQHFDMLGLSRDDPARNVVRFFNPLAEDQSIMRSTLLPGLLENLCRNINHQNREVRLFEIGKVFYPHQGRELPDEPLRLTALLSGRRRPGSSVLHYGSEVTDILDVKGVAELLLDELHLPEVSLERSSDTLSYVEPDSFVLMKSKDTKIGEFGKCTGKMLKMFGIKQDVFYLRLNIDAICRLRPAETVFKPLPKFPAVKWDIAVLVPEHVGGGEMVQAIMNSGGKLVEKAEIFDIYRGKTIKKNFKSVGISVTYRSEENTLDDNMVGVAHKKNIQLILSGFEGQLREE